MLWIAFLSLTTLQNVDDTLPTAKTYVVSRTVRPPKLDGHIEAGEWAAALWSEDFIDITGDPGRPPRHSTRCRMLWDDSCLYIAADLVEPNLWGTLTRHDAIIFQDNDFEIFLDPNGDAEQYFEIEVNALNTVMDLFMNRPYRKGGTYDMGWDARLRSAVQLRGSVNNPRDLDQGWSIEMAIPFEAMYRPGRRYQPVSGDRWRINFSRVQWLLDPVPDGYVRRKETSGKPLPEDNWVWSPMGLVNMHLPERWGYLIFSK